MKFRLGQWVKEKATGLVGVIKEIFCTGSLCVRFEDGLSRYLYADNLSPVPKTIETIEKGDGLQKGINTFKVLEVIGDLVYLSYSKHNDDVWCVQSKTELIKYDYKIIEPKDEDIVTVKWNDVAKKLGVSSEKLRIEKGERKE